MKNKTLIQGLILGAGQVGGKILSLAFIFLLANKVKPIGLHLYTYAYIPFSLFLDLSSFGLIPGTSKVVSKLLAKNRISNTHYLIKTGTIISIVLGIIFFIVINIFSQQILKVTLYSGYTKEEYDIILNNLKFASLSLLIFPLLSFYKGYLQGHMRMLPSALAIIVENFIRLSFFILISKNINDSIFSKIFIINFCSYLIPLFLLFCFVFKYYLSSGKRFHSINYLYKSVIPFGTATFFFTIYQLIDSITLSTIDPHVYTTYMFETTRLIFVPIIICQSIGGVITPRINSLIVNDEKKAANLLANKITRVAILFLIPVIYIFKEYNKDIYTIFYGDGNYNILSDTAIYILFIGFYKILIGLSQGMPKFELIISSTIISSIAKLILNYILIPSLGYKGAIIATIIAISVNMLFAYIVLYKGGIKIFESNMKSLVLSVISLIISIYLNSIFNSIYINTFSKNIEMIVNISFNIAFYLLIVTFVQCLLSTKLKKMHNLN